MNAAGEEASTQLKAFKSLVTPVVRFWLRRSYSFQDFHRVAKEVFIEVAEEEIRKTSPKVNVSRVSAMTGLQRHDINRVLEEKKKRPKEQPGSVLTRVIGQWRHSKQFTTKSGAPRVLQYKGDESEFRELVETISKSINPGTILFELERIDAVAKTKRGLRLVTRMPGLGADVTKGFELLGQDVDTLIKMGTENVLDQKKPGNLHVRTEYDNIYQKDLTEIRQWLIEEGKAFHERLRLVVSRFDKDVSPKLEDEPAGGRVVFTSFSLTSPPEEATGKSPEASDFKGD